MEIQNEDEMQRNCIGGSGSADTSVQLRYGIMCHHDGITQFALDCIQNISDLAVLELLIVDVSEPRSSSTGEKLKKGISLEGNLWYLQNKIFPLRDIPAYRRKSLDDCFPHIARLPCVVSRKGRWSEYFSPEDIARIQEHHLDFILKFGYGIIRGDIFSAARLGIWSYHHDDEEKYRGGPPGFWEIVKGDPVTGVLLQRINETLDGGVVLKKIYVPTAGTSYRRNLQRIQESSTHMVRWVCLDVAHGKAEYLEGAPSKSQAPIYRAPNDFQMLRFWSRLAGNWFRYKIANQRVDEWNIGIARVSPQEFLNETFMPKVEWTSYREKHQMVADPCLFPSSDGVRVLCEEFDWFSESGRILEISAALDGTVSRLKPAIDEPAHMSYPYTFEHDGEIYCIPECAERREIAIYRWDGSTKTWKRDCVLLDNIEAVDSTIFQFNESWWLFHSMQNAPGAWSLWIWTADDIRGPWRPHPANPVKTDISSTRPAGRPFWHEGKLYRPAQDNRTCYGGALAINRIESLSMTEFREITVRRIVPGANWPYRDGVHTLNGFNGISVIDAKRNTWPIDLILKRFWYRHLGLNRPRQFQYGSGGLGALSENLEPASG